ncbi:MAG: FAD-dependent oxidoreductase [Halioglobus sp.]
MTYSNLLAPGRIAELELRNRIIMTPMGTNLAQADGHCGERLQAYYEARARGGVGMVIVGVGAIAWPAGACNPNQVAISTDEFLPGLSALAARIKAQGCRAAIQIQHAGKVAVCDIAAGRPMLVPAIPKSSPDEMTAALTPEELGAFVKSYSKKGAKVEYKVADKADINWLIERFSDAADRAKRAGFEGVELHAGHGYILSEFLSPHVNTRDDEYGGSLENRTRLLREVIVAVKTRVGKAFPVWCRLDSLEYRVDGGICFEDAVATAVIAESAGADAIHVSAYANPSSGVAFTEAPLVHEPGGYLGFAAGIKKQLAIPVIAVGRIEPEIADAVIGRSEADFVAMGRKLLADPELPNKLMRGQASQVRPCIYCYSCVSRIFVNDHVRCAVNAQTGFETETLIEPAREARNVLVIGGGPAGMESARVAALRGHAVTLVERSQALGGTVYFSSIVYAENGRLIDYLAGQMQQLNIEVLLNTRVDADFLKAQSPEAVVVATGARRDALPIPGADLNHVFSGDELRALMTGEPGAPALGKLSLLQRLLLASAGVLRLTRSANLMRRLSHLWMPLGKQVLIIGGGLVGVELAEFLAHRGRKVVVVESGEKFGVELALVRRWRVLDDLQRLGVVMINNAKVARIEPRVAWIEVDGAQVDIAAHSVIIAAGAAADLSIARISEGLGFDTHVAGDCDGVSYIEGAIRSGHAVGRVL